MRERIRDKERLEHILAAMDVIIANKGRFNLDLIENDPIVFYGFVKQVEIIGKAVYMLTKEFRAAHPEVEWDEIEGMRHVLVHGYYQIRPSQLWDTIENDIPELQLNIRSLYESME